MEKTAKLQTGRTMKTKGKNAIRRTGGERVFDVLNSIFLVLLCIVMVYPFWYVLVLSFNTGSDAASGPLWLWPRVWTLKNYEYVFGYEALQVAFRPPSLAVRSSLPISCMPSLG